MLVTGYENQKINLEEAAKLTAKYRESVEKDSITAGYFSMQSINSLLTQSGCIGIRIYYGLTEENKPQMVIVGIDSNGNDLADGNIMEHAWTCPPFCSKPNPLNS
jgi:hypothetical protein